MADSGQTTDAVQPEPVDTAAAVETAPEIVTAPMSDGYHKRQIGLFGILLIISGLGFIGQIIEGNYGAIGNLVVYVISGLGFLYIEVQDKGDYMLVTTGPIRWFLCGWGKEKVKYSEIVDYAQVKTCWYTIPESGCCTGVRLLNQCSCFEMACCGPAGTLSGGCCAQRTIRLTIKERMFAQDAADGEGCCLEEFCLKKCFGTACAENCLGGVCGEGCCFSMCNPCGVNCCSMNTMYISTNDPEGLLKLIGDKTGNSATI